MFIEVCIREGYAFGALLILRYNDLPQVNANAQRHPLKRVGNPDDIAAMADFLLSDRAKFITGQVITIDGGISSLKV